MIKKVKASGMLAAIMERNDSRSLRRTRRKMIVAARIADALEAAGLSQKEFAQMMENSHRKFQTGCRVSVISQ